MACIAESSITEVGWYKDGKKITQSSRYQIQTSADGICCFYISDVSERDQGEYTCEIISAGGAVAKSSFSFVGQVFQTIYKKVTAFVSTHKSVKGEFLLK